MNITPFNYDSTYKVFTGETTLVTYILMNTVKETV